ncbi:MAG: YjjG family noncanonical pyrimidine nucleotidase [Bacteroidota bacterium]
MSKPYEWLLFDVDNTLLDFSRAAELAFFAMLADFDLPVIGDAYAIYQKGNHQVWTELEAGKITQDELKAKRFQLYLNAQGQEADPQQMNTSFLDNLVDHSVLIDGCLDLLESLKVHYRMSIVTNGLKAVQRPRLQKTHVEHYFHTIIVSEEIGFAKPQAAFFDVAFREMGYPDRKQTIVIGDSLQSDIRGGLEYGIDTCWYNPTKVENTSAYQPTMQVSSLEELKDRLLG